MEGEGKTCACYCGGEGRFGGCGFGAEEAVHGDCYGATGRKKARIAASRGWCPHWLFEL